MKFSFTRSDSGTFDPVTKRYLWPPGVNATGRRMLFTGPDGIGDQKVTVNEENRYVGVGTMSPEGTSDLSYLWRPDWRFAPPMVPKQKRVGGIGWGISEFPDTSILRTGQQIQKGEFRQRAEDRHTHLYQNPWTPPPSSQFRRPRTAPARRMKQDYLLDTENEFPLNSKGHVDATVPSSSESSQSQFGY